jgi:hypothetical protein
LIEQKHIEIERNLQCKFFIILFCCRKENVRGETIKRIRSLKKDDENFGMAR